MKSKLLLFVFPLLIGCVTTQEVLVRNPVSEKSKSINISGTYKNTPNLSSFYRNSLIAVLEQKLNHKKETPDWQNIDVKITLTKKEMIIEGIKNNTVVYTKKYSGNEKDNYFILNRKTRFVGFPLFFNFLDSIIIISIDENNHLQLSQAHYSMGFYFLMAADLKDYRKFTYQKIN